MSAVDLYGRLPVRFRERLRPEELEGVEEIRLRVGQPLELLYGDTWTGVGRSVTNESGAEGGGAERRTSHRGTESRTACGGVWVRQMDRVEPWDITEMLNYLTGYSLYAYEEEIRQGFFTIEGGHRVGVVGHTNVEQEGSAGSRIAGMLEFSGLNVRIAMECRGVSLPLVPYIREGDTIRNTLILAAPGVGKTTWLRDAIRILSSGSDGGMPLKVSVVDERSEIAACHRGVPQNDLGPRTDVLDNCPKRQGMQMLLRSMSPQILAVDELGGEEDFRILEQMLYCGSKILGTVHAASADEILDKEYLRGMYERRAIGRWILLRRGNGGRSFSVFDERLHRLS